MSFTGAPPPPLPGTPASPPSIKPPSPSRPPWPFEGDADGGPATGIGRGGTPSVEEEGTMLLTPLEARILSPVSRGQGRRAVGVSFRVFAKKGHRTEDANGTWKMALPDTSGRFSYQAARRGAGRTRHGRGIRPIMSSDD